MDGMVNRDSKGRPVSIRVASDDLETQGPGSWVEFRRRLKVRHLRAVAKMATFQNVSFKENPGEALDMIGQIGEVMAPLVRGWNWVDEEGAPLPQPAGRPEVFEELEFEELMWLIDKMAENVGKAAEKNRS